MLTGESSIQAWLQPAGFVQVTHYRSSFLHETQEHLAMKSTESAQVLNLLKFIDQDVCLQAQVYHLTQTPFVSSKELQSLKRNCGRKSGRIFLSQCSEQRDCSNQSSSEGCSMCPGCCWSAVLSGPLSCQVQSLPSTFQVRGPSREMLKEWILWSWGPGAGLIPCTLFSTWPLLE